MKPSFEALKALYPHLSTRHIQCFLERLSDHYFDYFPSEKQYLHLQALSLLSSESPVKLFFEMMSEKEVACTILGFDHPLAFSLITGILSASGYSISSGTFFRYQKSPLSSSLSLKMKKQIFRSKAIPYEERQKLIYYCTGQLFPDTAFEKWTHSVEDHIQNIMALLESFQSDDEVKARQQVNEMVAKKIETMKRTEHAFFYPTQLMVDHSFPAFTRLKVISQDTPFFLYSLATSLDHLHISIQHIDIKTLGRRIEDELDLIDASGKKIEDMEAIDQLKLAVILIKQFTYFLDKAPNPYNAVTRFGLLIQSILQQPKRGQWIHLLSRPKALQKVARLLGASDFIWENFIRLHVESLLPILKPHLKEEVLYEGETTQRVRLEQILDQADSYEKKKEALNTFKDQELYFIDIHHLLGQSTFDVFSRQLTHLAELIISASVNIIFSHVARRFGRPKTIAELDVKWGVFGLGKLGGEALGYASDLELLFIYSDSGHTDGLSSISNAEFFEQLLKDLNHFIVTKQNGIFALDFRLRPYGQDGPLAVSLESFCDYFGKEGRAHAYEKLALIQLRKITGDEKFCEKMERIRDELLYTSSNVDPEELWNLRKKQYEEKSISSQFNAKFSPGGLVDIEYAAQLLQVLYGKEEHQLRTPHLPEALSRLQEAGILTEEEYSQIRSAYIFFRNLINSLRMARGSAQDVTLPLLESEEYDHLARRAGYASDGRFSAASQLHLDIETQSATVRRFVERYFTRSSLPSQRIGNVVDLILVDSVPPELQQKIMTQVGFKNPTRAYFNLMKLAKSGKNRDQFAKLGVLAFDALLHKADPDRALNNWERFAREVPNPDAHFKLLLRQPMRLDILLDIFSSSQFLSDTLIQHPNYFSWATHPHILRQEIRRGVFSEELGTLKRTCRNLKEWYRELRRFRRKELLRIAIRDICLQESLVSITRSLSLLAESIVQIALEYAWEYVIPEEETRRVFENRFCILAFGKCGASELNYSSDIDLIAFYEDEKSDEKNADEIRAIYKKVIDRLTQSLTAYTEEGYVYRMDFTLRPFGRSGEWLSSFAGLTRYYQNSAALWEIQALLKTRPLAGNWWLGWTFLHDISSLLRRPYPKEDIIASIKKLRELSAQKSGKHGQVVDIKSGHGGIRDIEFLAQGLQLIYGQRFPEIFTRKTLSTLERLKRVGLLPFEIGEQLKKYYIFFRQLEHFMQLVEDRRIHALPKDRHELESLAKKLLGNRATPEQLMAYLENSLSTVHQIFNDYLG